VGSFPTRAKIGSKKGTRGTRLTAHSKNVLGSPKCGRRLANDIGVCDRVAGHTGAHSNAWLRKHGQP
jgi:hypothetical protein